MSRRVVPSLAVVADPGLRDTASPQLREALDALVMCQSRHEQACRAMQEISRELERVKRMLTTKGSLLTLVAEVPATADEPARLPALEITCFGGFEVRRAGQPVKLCANRNGQAILRFLIAAPRHRASMDVLVEALWPQDAPEVARHKLHCAFSALRRSLNNGVTDRKGGGYLLCRASKYELNPAITLRIDQDEFLTHYRNGRQAGGSVAIAHYEAACSLYQDPFLPEDLYDDWSAPHRAHLESIYLTMCRALAAHCLAAAQPEDAAGWASRIIEARHCDESAFRQLMLAYAAIGRRDEVMRQYRRCELLLREELDVTPSQETITLLKAILSGNCQNVISAT